MSLFSKVATGLQVGLSFLGARKEADLANEQAQITEAKLRANKDANLSELDRQAGVTPSQFSAQRVDVMRGSREQLGRVDAFTSEAGTSASTARRFQNELRFATDTDLARIDFNEVQELEAIEAAKEAVETGFGSDIATSRNRRDVATSQAWMGFGSSALQIGGLWYSRWAEAQAATNTIGVD